MGEFLDKVREKANSPLSLAHRIALYLDSNDKRAILVEAGDDKFFYASLAKRYDETKGIEFFSAGRRSNVIVNLRILSDLGKETRSFGIVDRDFNFDEDKTILNGRCFVTGVYSYENYFFDRETLADYGVASFSLEAGSKEYEAYFSAVEIFLSNFPNVLIREHIEAYWCKISGKKCHFGNFSVCHAIAVTRDGVLTPNMDSHEQFIQQTSAELEELTGDQFDSISHMFESMRSVVFFRGHFFWELFVGFLNEFRRWLDNEFVRTGRPRTRTKSTISERHALEAAVAFLKTPLEIEGFLFSVVA